MLVLSPLVRTLPQPGCHGDGDRSCGSPTYADDMVGPEDATLVTLARAACARSGTAEGAAVRDLDGRTYAASAVSLPSLRLSALRLAVAMAVSSGGRGLEAAAIVSAAGAVAPDDLDTVRDVGGPGVVVHVVNPSGQPRAGETT